MTTDFTRAGAETGDLTTIRALKDRLLEAQKDLAVLLFRMDVDLQINATTKSPELSVQVTTEGSRGLSLMITSEQLTYYQDDVQAIIEQVVDKILEFIYREEVRSRVRGPIVTAMNNFKQLRKAGKL